MFLRLAAALLAIVSLAALAGCRMELDRGYCADAGVAAQAAVDPEAVRRRAREAADLDGGPTLFGRLAPDTGGRARRLEAEARRRDDPTQPTIGQIRAARAEAIARVDIQRRSLGDTMVRSDGSASKLSQVEFVAAPNALTLTLDAAPDLNHFAGASHALLLVVYHLSDTTQYNALVGNPEGVIRLLEGRAFHRTVKAVESYFIQPGSCETVVLDRPADGRHVALVAGYGELTRGDRGYLASYGIGASRVREAAFRKATEMYSPLPLSLHVALEAGGFAVYDQGMQPDPLLTRAPKLPDRIHTIY